MKRKVVTSNVPIRTLRSGKRGLDRKTSSGLKGGLPTWGSFIPRVDGTDTRPQRDEDDRMALNEAGKNEPLMQRNWRAKTFEKAAGSSEICPKWGGLYMCEKEQKLVETGWKYWREEDVSKDPFQD